jgi:hypothetical protein
MKAIIWIGAVLAMLTGLAGVGSVIAGFNEPGVPVTLLVGVGLLLFTYVLSAFLFLLQAVGVIRDALKSVLPLSKSLSEPAPEQATGR